MSPNTEAKDAAALKKTPFVFFEELGSGSD